MSSYTAPTPPDLESTPGRTTEHLTPRMRRVHASLYRPALFAGVEQPVAIVEATVATALLFGVGFHVTTFALVAVIVGLVHPVMVWAAKHDPQITEVYIRSLSGCDYYPAQGMAHAPAARVRPTIPRLR